MLKKDKKKKEKTKKEENLKEDDFSLTEEGVLSNVKVNVDSSSKDLYELIEKNIKWCQVIYAQNKKIKKRLTLITVGNYLRLAIIIIPIVFGIIYLPPLIDNMLDQYGSVLGIGVGNSSNLLQDIDLGDLFK